MRQEARRHQHIKFRNTKSLDQRKNPYLNRSNQNERVSKSLMKEQAIQSRFPKIHNLKQLASIPTNKQSSLLYFEAIRNYFPFNPPLAISIQKLGKEIAKDALLVANLTMSLTESRLNLNTIEEFLQLLNKLILLPPLFSNIWEFHCDHLQLYLNHISSNSYGKVVFSQKKVNFLLKNVLDQYLNNLKTPASLKHFIKDKWFSEQGLELVDYSLYKCNTEYYDFGFSCYLDWYLREFNDNVRKIGAGSPPLINKENIILNVCESTPLSLPNQPYLNAKETAEFCLQNGGNYSLNHIFINQQQNPSRQKTTRQHASRFQNGTVYQAYLTATSYHLWHSPIDGIIIDVYQLQGSYFLHKPQNVDFDPSCLIDSQSFLSATSKRLVIIIKADNPFIGVVGLVFLGLIQKSAVIAKQRVVKGEKLGHFLLGGSSYLMFLQKQVSLVFAHDLYQPREEGKPQVLVGKIRQVKSYLAHIVVK